MRTVSAKPWYREPWPWILMAGPATVVLAGVITTWLAVASFDGLVADDYYKQGLAINQVLARKQRAQALGLAGRLELNRDTGALSVRLDAADAVALPRSLTLKLAHATRPGLDQSLELLRGPAAYSGRAAALAPGRWHAVVEDHDGQWRIRGELRMPGEGVARLQAY